MVSKRASQGPWWKRVWSSSGTRGSAVIEFVLVAVVALVPLAMAAVGIARVQGLHATTASAAGEAARTFAAADSREVGATRAVLAARVVLQAEGVDPDDVRVDFVCDRRPCLQPGATVRVTVSSRLPDAALPVPGLHLPLTASASAVGTVDRYRGSP